MKLENSSIVEKQEKYCFFLRPFVDRLYFYVLKK